MRFLVGELGQEVFIDAAKNVTIGLLQSRIVEDPQDLPQNLIVEFRVFLLWQQALQRFVITLDALHGCNEGGRGALAFRQADQRVELGFWAQVDRTAAGEVFLGQLPYDTAPAG